MEDAINNAVKTGAMANDQATTLKNDLTDVTQILSQAQTNQAGAATATTGTQLTDDDRKKIFSELQDVQNQLRSALNPQGTTSAASSDQVNNLFAFSMDTNGDGNISKDEFTTFLNNLAQSKDYYAQAVSAQNISTTQSTFSVMA